MKNKKVKSSVEAKKQTAVDIAAESTVNKFVANLVESIEKTPDEVCCWSPNGLEFIIADHNRFVNIHKKGTKFDSFIRQLHYYGFTKARRHGKTWRFSHKYFRKGRPDLLYKVVRNPTPLKTEKQKTQYSEELIDPGYETMLRLKDKENSELRGQNRLQVKEIGRLKRKIELLETKAQTLERSRDRIVESMQRKEREAMLKGIPNDPSAITRAAKCQTDDEPPQPSLLATTPAEGGPKTPVLPRLTHSPRTLTRAKADNPAGTFDCNALSRSSSISSILSEPAKGAVSRAGSFTEMVSALESEPTKGLLFRSCSFTECFGINTDMAAPPLSRATSTQPFFEAPKRISRMNSFTRDLQHDADAQVNEFVAEDTNESFNTVQTLIASCGDGGAKSEVSKDGGLSVEELAELILDSPDIDSKTFVNAIVQKFSGIQKITIAEEPVVDS